MNEPVTIADAAWSRCGPTLVALAIIAAVSSVALGCGAKVTRDGPAEIVENPTSRIRTWEVGTGRAPLVMLHGYGSAPAEWLQFTPHIKVPGTMRFVFPEAPERSVPPDGPIGGRAWWRLELASYRTNGRSGPPDMSRARPAGLGRAVDTVQRLTSDLQVRLGYRREEIILGGFSQGAMIAADVAFRTNEPMRALVLLSGTTVDEAAWIAAMPARRGLPVFIAHGRQDDVLPFAASERLQQAMREAGLRVTWVPFDGGHYVPVEVVSALNAFLARLEASSTLE